MTGGSTKHTLTLVDRKLITVTAVDEVVSFDETTVTLSAGGSLLNISGDNLSVTKLSLSEGEVVISGEIDAAVYYEQEKKRSLLGRFKK